MTIKFDSNVLVVKGYSNLVRKIKVIQCCETDLRSQLLIIIIIIIIVIVMMMIINNIYSTHFHNNRRSQ